MILTIGTDMYCIIVQYLVDVAGIPSIEPSRVLYQVYGLYNSEEEATRVLEKYGFDHMDQADERLKESFHPYAKGFTHHRHSDDQYATVVRVGDML